MLNSKKSSMKGQTLGRKSAMGGERRFVLARRSGLMGAGDPYTAMS